MKPCWSTLNASFLSLRELLKKTTLFTDELFKFGFLLFTTRPAMLNTYSLAALVAITQNDHCDLETPCCFLATTEKCRNTLLPQALGSNEFFAHATFTCIGSTFSYRHKESPIPRPPHARTHRWFRTHPIQDSDSCHTSIVWIVQFLLFIMFSVTLCFAWQIVAALSVS